MDRIEIEEWLARPAKLPERTRLIEALEYYSNAYECLETEFAKTSVGLVEIDPARSVLDD